MARWFLSVGAASGTVAQAISAYDKTVSDDTYGAGTRYVSKERLAGHARPRISAPAHPARAKFAATIPDFLSLRTPSPPGTTREPTSNTAGSVSASRPNPVAEPNQILLHINLQDPTAQLQQQAIGTLGVNLIYACLPPAVFPNGLSGRPLRRLIP